MQGTAYYVMPFVDGESLRDRLTREKQLPIPDAVRIASEVASALDYAHRHGVIHRDIKPENILLHDGQALVADFGIALAVSHAGGSRMTETGMSLGTPHYMSPEQAMGEREITARSDVYALGCVTYEMLIGDPPFTGSTAQAIVAKVLTADPAPLTAQRRSVSPQVEAAVLDRAGEASGRPVRNPAEFAAALNGRSDGADGAILPPKARAPRSAIVAGALALVALGFLAGRWAGGRDDAGEPSPSCSGAFATKRSTTPASRRTDRPSSIAPPRRPAPPSCSSSAPTIRRRPPSASPHPPPLRFVEGRAGRPGPRGIRAPSPLSRDPGARPARRRRPSRSARQRAGGRLVAGWHRAGHHPRCGRPGPPRIPHRQGPVRGLRLPERSARLTRRAACRLRRAPVSLG